MKIEDSMRIIRLIDTYGTLLTTKQYDVMVNYYFDNLTLSEIGDNYGISRQAVNDCLNQSIKALEVYEEKLHDIEKTDTVISELTALASSCGSCELSEKITKIIEYLRG